MIVQTLILGRHAARVYREVERMRFNNCSVDDLSDIYQDDIPEGWHIVGFSEHSMNDGRIW